MRVLILCILGALFLTEVTCFIKSAKLHPKIKKREALGDHFKLPNFHHMVERHRDHPKAKRAAHKVHSHLDKIYKKLGEALEKGPMKKRSVDKNHQLRKMQKFGAHPRDKKLI